MTPAQLKELKKLCAEAAAGPWRSESYGGETGYVSEIYTIATGDDGDRENAMTKETASFIAAARTAVPELIAEVERLRGLVKEAECSGYELMAGAGRAASIKCPWCYSYRPATGDFHHGVDCPAFGPEGEVK